MKPESAAAEAARAALVMIQRAADEGAEAPDDRADQLLAVVAEEMVQAGHFLRMEAQAPEEASRPEVRAAALRSVRNLATAAVLLFATSPWAEDLPEPKMH